MISFRAQHSEIHLHMSFTWDRILIHVITCELMVVFPFHFSVGVKCLFSLHLHYITLWFYPRFLFVITDRTVKCSNRCLGARNESMRRSDWRRSVKRYPLYFSSAWSTAFAHYFSGSEHRYKLRAAQPQNMHNNERLFMLTSKDTVLP